jgi:hypothetical protein
MLQQMLSGKTEWLLSNPAGRLSMEKRGASLKHETTAESGNGLSY